jgi:hypothetical protein
MTDDKRVPDTFGPEDVERALRVWFLRAKRWSERLQALAKQHDVPMPHYSRDYIIAGNHDGVNFDGKTVEWIELMGDEPADRFEAPYDVVRTDHAADTWLDEWLTQALKEKNDRRILLEAQSKTAEQRRIRAQYEEYLRLKAIFEEKQGSES